MPKFRVHMAGAETHGGHQDVDAQTADEARKIVQKRFPELFILKIKILKGEPA